MVRINAIAISISALLSPALAVAQDGDSLRTSRLDEVVIHGEKLFTIERLPDIQGTWFWAGKKNGLINVQKLDANITEKTARQIFSKVPGLFVYDMDGSGNQINISTRDLDLHRGWESNIRKKNFYPGSDARRSVVELAIAFRV